MAKKNNLNQSMNKKSLLNDILANGYSIAWFLSFHRRLQNNNIHHLESGAFNSLPELKELYLYLIMY